MDYNINYEISSIIIIGIVLIARNAFFEANGKVTKRFRLALVLVAVMCGFNVFACLCENGVLQISSYMWVVIKSIYYLLYAYILMLQISVVSLRVDNKGTGYVLVNLILFVLLFITLILNMRFQFLFELVNGKCVVHAALNGIYVLYAILYIEMMLVMRLHKDAVRRNVYWVSLTIVVFPVICQVLMVFRDKLELTGLGLTLSMLLYCISLGDQDYELLQETADDLRSVQDEERENLEIVKTANRVKTRFMEKISLDFKEPVAKVMEINKQIEEASSEEAIKEYTLQIEEAGEQLISFVNDLMEAAQLSKKEKE